MPEKHKNKLILLSSMILFMWAGFACAGELEDAKDAYGAGRFAEAADLLRPLVRADNTEAVYLQARMYEKGDGVSKDLKEARRLYSIAAAAGHEASQQKLDVFNVQSGDKSVVIDWYLPAAQEGDTEAQYNLGFMYETGWGVPENTTEAIRWYQEASEMQHDVAQLRLGMMTIIGVGIEASTSNGLVLLHQSAENGNRIAEILVQDLFDVGDIDEQSAKQLVSGIRRIFDDGEMETINTLRRSLEALRKGTSVSESSVVSTHEPADNSSTPTNPSPISIKEEKLKNEEDNTSTTTKLIDFVKSVTQGATAARKSEIVVKKIVPKADKKIIERENRKVAQGNLFKWYSEEAAKGEADAQYNLGVLYIKGDQVEQDTEEGLYWMKLAVEQGHELAIIYMKLWEDDFGQNTFTSTIAVDWLKQSARKWNQQSVFTLGTLYETGRGVEKNFKHAMQWYKFAAVNGHSSAKRRLALIRKGGALLEQEGISRQGESIVLPESLLMILGIAVAAIVFLFFCYTKFIKPRRISAVPEKYQERVVMAKAKNSQGLQADDRKFFDELWAVNAPKEVIKAEEKPRERKPEVAATPSMEKSKPEQVSAPSVEAVKSKSTEEKAEERKSNSESLSQIETRLAKAVEDLVNGDNEKEQIKSKKSSNGVDDKKLSSGQPTNQEQKIVISDKASIEKVTDSTKSDVSIESSDKETDQSEFVLGADSFINSMISIDELAASRVSADSLFADGVAIDEAGRAVGQGSYDPHKLDADTVIFDGASSISIKSVTASWDEGQIKPRPVGAAASLLPKQPSITKIEVEPVSIDLSSEAIEKHDIEGPLTNDEERSLAEVHYNIGLMFSSGDGVPMNETQAAKWFLKAAEEGLPEGQYSLGQAYLNGSGVVMNTELALDWIQKAAENNYKPALDMLKAQNKAI